MCASIVSLRMVESDPYALDAHELMWPDYDTIGNYQRKILGGIPLN